MSMANVDTPHKKLQCFSCLTSDGNERVFKYESRKWLSDDFNTKLQKICDPITVSKFNTNAKLCRRCVTALK